MVSSVQDMVLIPTNAMKATLILQQGLLKIDLLCIVDATVVSFCYVTYFILMVSFIIKLLLLLNLVKLSFEHFLHQVYG